MACSKPASCNLFSGVKLPVTKVEKCTEPPCLHTRYNSLLTAVRSTHHCNAKLEKTISVLLLLNGKAWASPTNHWLVSGAAGKRWRACSIICADKSTPV